MTVYTAASFSDLLNDASISATNMELIVDAAINSLNLLGAETITNMAGDAGAKTVTLTSKQHGAVVYAVRLIYLGVWKVQQIGASSTLGQTLSTADVFANPTIVALLEKAAERLSEIPFIVAEDTSGIDET